MVNQEVVTPYDIAPLKADLIEAVTNAYMAKKIPEITGLTWDHGSCKKGEFRYKSPSPDNVLGFSLEPDTGYYCTYPGGVWKEDETFLPDGEKSSSDTIYGTGELFDAAATFAMIESVVGTWIDPWADCPSPNAFSNQINSLANVAEQLYIGDQVTFGGQDVDTVEADRENERASAVTDLRSAVDEIDTSTNDMRGVAIDAFQRSYGQDVGRTIGGQRGLATAAGLAITAEAMAWNETLTSVRDFVKRATYDFNTYAGATDGGGEAVEATLGAVSAVAGLAGATIGLAFPPFGAAMAVVGGVATVGTLMFPAQEARNPEALKLNGGDYDGYWRAFKDGLLAISEDLLDAELAIRQGCQNMVDDLYSYPDNYSITKRTSQGGANGGQGPLDDLGDFLTTQIDFNGTKMRNVAGAVNSIGDHQRALGGMLGGTDAVGNPSTTVDDEWSRGSLPEGGSIGFGYSGPLTSYQSLVAETVDLLMLEQGTAHRVAEKCIEIALDFEGTDAERKTALDDITRTFDTVAVQQANVPS